MIIGISGQAGAGKDTTADIAVEKNYFAKVSLADPLKRIARDVFAFTDVQLWGPSEERNKPDHRYPREHTYPSPTESLLAGQMTCACCGFTYDNRVTPYAGEPQCYLTPRYALQLLGTEWGRKCYGNVWVDYALRTAKILVQNDPSVFYSQQLGIIQTSPTSEEYMGCTECSGVVIPDCRFRNEIDAIHAAGGKLIRVKMDVAGLKGAAAQHASEKEQQSIPDSVFDYIIDNNESLEKLSQKVHLALEMLRAES